MKHTDDLAEVATLVLELWEAFAGANPLPHLSPLPAYFRQSAYLAGMAGAAAKFLDGTAGFLYESENIAVACCPPLWPTYRDDCCLGESDELLALQEGAFLRGMADAFAVLSDGTDPVEFSSSIMAASLVTIRAEAARKAEEN